MAVSKDNPDAVVSAQPGKSEVKPSIRPTVTGSAGHKDVGDKREAHTSEEELGVTTTPDGGDK